MSLELIGVPILLLLVLMVVTRLHRPSSRTKPHKQVEGTEERLALSKASKECPRCGQTMEEGNLYGPSGIYWRRDEPPLGLASRILGEPIGFSTLIRGPMKSQYFRAYRCLRCGIIHVELGDEFLI